MALQIKKIAGALGAEISGVNLSQGVSPDLAAELRSAWLENLVIFFRDQALDLPQFLHLGRMLGEPVEYPFVNGMEGYPEIIEVKKLEHETVNFGGVWHADTTYLDIPPMGTMLIARELPPYGGDTMFANQYLAYEGLSDTMQRLLVGLKGISTSAKADVSKTREDRLKTDAKQGAKTEYQAMHPIVRTHPETGRKSLYVNIAHTAGIEGMTEAESTPLLNFLFAHQVKPEFTCRFNWRLNSIAFWDNRCAQHNPVNDYHGFRRILHRITLRGDRPV
jgi:taurine dioxygenase